MQILLGVETNSALVQPIDEQLTHWSTTNVETDVETHVDTKVETNVEQYNQCRNSITTSWLYLMNSIANVETYCVYPM